jgi:hypothetical protein
VTPAYIDFTLSPERHLTISGKFGDLTDLIDRFRVFFSGWLKIARSFWKAKSSISQRLALPRLHVIDAADWEWRHK